MLQPQESCELHMAKDSLYQRITPPVPPFEFDARVASVFDDMIHRSVPFYSEIISRQAQIIQRFHQPGTVVYDLGCSTGNLAAALAGPVHGHPALYDGGGGQFRPHVGCIPGAPDRHPDGTAHHPARLLRSPHCLARFRRWQ